jgi:hypothetical protein
LGKTLKQLYRETDSSELTEWQAYHNLEPWGEQKADVRAGIIASTIANVNKGKNTKAFSYENFILKSKLELEYEAKRKKKQPIKQMANTLMNMVKKKRKKNGD